MTLDQAVVYFFCVASSTRREEWVVARNASSGNTSGLSTRLGSTFSMTALAPSTGQMYWTYADTSAATSGS